jgi:hypothetical protein
VAQEFGCNCASCCLVRQMVGGPFLDSGVEAQMVMNLPGDIT